MRPPFLRTFTELFKNDFTNRLRNLSVSHEDNLGDLRKVRANIKDHFEFNQERKQWSIVQILLCAQP